MDGSDEDCLSQNSARTARKVLIYGILRGRYYSQLPTAWKFAV
jgi:hypothetical protein